MVHVVIKLHLQLVFQLTVLLQELFVVDGVCEVLVILRQQVHLAVADPGVELVAHGVLSPDAAVLTTLQQEKTVNFFVQVLPVEHMGNPADTVSNVEETKSELPRPVEWIDEKDVPTERHSSVQENIWVLEVDSGVLDIVAAVEEHFTLSIEFTGVGWLVDFVSALEVLGRTLQQLLLGGEVDLVKIVHLAEVTLLCVVKRSY